MGDVGKALDEKSGNLPKAVVTIAGFGLFVFVIFSPVFMLIVEAIKYIAIADNDWVGLLIPGQRRLVLLLQSIALSGITALAASVLGLLIALQLLEWRKGVPALLRWLVLLILVIPPYVHVNAWKFFFDRINPVLQYFGIAPFPLQGFTVSCLVLTAAYIPISTGLSLLGMEAVNRELVDMGKTFRSDMEVFLKLLLPLSSRFILAGAGIVFLMSFIDYTIPSLLQFNVYSLEIFAEFSATNEPATAFLLALPLLLVALLIFMLSQGNLKKIGLSNLWNRPQSASRMRWTWWFETILQLAVLFFIAVLVLPFICLAIQAGPIGKVALNIISSAEAFKYSIITSLLASLMSIPFAVIAAEGLNRKGIMGKAWWLVVAIPLAMPAPLVGIGLIEVWNRELFGGLYSSILMPVLASAVRFTTISVLVVWSYMSRFDSLLNDAAKLFGKNVLQIWLGIKLPMLLPGIISAFFITFALSLGELGATLITVPPGKFTATIKIYNYLHYGSNDAVAGLCLFMLVIAVAAGLAALFSFSRRKSND